MVFLILPSMPRKAGAVLCAWNSDPPPGNNSHAHSAARALVASQARTMARLGSGHVNIVTPTEVVLTGTYVMFLVEYVKGGSVSDFLRRAKMDEALACYLFRQLLDAIAFCHRHKVRASRSARRRHGGRVFA